MKSQFLILTCVSSPPSIGTKVYLISLMNFQKHSPLKEFENVFSVKSKMRLGFIQFIYICNGLCLLYLCACCITAVNSESANLNQSPESKCDILKYILDFATEEVGQKIEILVALSDDMRNCATNLSLSHHLIAVKSCSKKDWNIGNHYSSHCSSRPIYVFFACDLQDSVMILQTTFQKLILRFRWFIFHDSSSSVDLQLLNNLSTLDFRLDSLLQIIDVNDKYNIQEAYKISNNSGMIIRAASSWHGVAENKRDLQGITLRVTSVPDAHYEYDTKIEIGPDGFPVFLDSFTFQLLEALKFTMNFSIEVIVSDSWGDFNDDTNKWEGMIKDLLAGEADLAISSTADLPFRRTAIDFNMPTTTLKLSGFFKKPRAAVDAKALIEPFKSTFWFAVICAILSFSLVLILFKRILVRTMSLTKEYSAHIFSEEGSVKIDLQKLDTIGSRNNYADSNSLNDPQSLWDPLDCFQWALAAFCIQGFYNIPKYDCYRIVIGMGCLSGVLIYGAYAGTLISFLSVVVDSISSVEQLVANSFVLSIVGSNITLRFFRDSPSPWDRIVYQRRRLHPVYYGLDETKRELLGGSFVYFIDQLSGYNALNNKFSIKDSCSIEELRIPNGAQQQGSMVPKNSPYKRKIDFQILRMREIGLVHQLNKRFIPARNQCSNSVTFDGVQLTSVSVAFGILGIGALLSSAIVIIENGMRKIRKDDYNL